MKALLDTQTFLWWLTDDARLSPVARKIIADGGNELFFSAVSGWEIAVKAGLGKIKLPESPSEFLTEQLSINAIQILPVKMEHALQVAALPDIHADPFDRLLAAQSLLEKLPVVTADSVFAKYGVKVVW